MFILSRETYTNLCFKEPGLMRNIYFCFVLLLVFYFTMSSYYYSQTKIEWSKVNYGITGYTAVLTGDFKEYWKSPIGIGITVNYPVKPSLFLEGAFSISSVGHKDEYKNIPDIYLVNLPLGLKWYPVHISSAKLFIYSGLENNTFLFKGDAASKLKDNTSESEFGAFISLGINPGLIRYPAIELYTKYQTIFSSPENIQIYFLGMNIYFNE